MKAISLILLVFLSLVARSQEKESFYVFDADWKPTKIKSAIYFLHRHQVNDTCWQWDFYHMYGPLIRTERSRDKEGTELEGVCNHYNEGGYLDSTSMFRRRRKHGDFIRMAKDSLHPKIKYVYRDDSLMEVVYPDRIKKDTLLKFDDERESEYPGGVGAWSRYLQKKIQYPDRAMNSNIEGEVRVVFIIDKQGNVTDPYISHSVEYSLDEEALLIIKESGKWSPAFQNGKIVKSYKAQPIVFRLR
jgi:protein TonB